MNLSREALDAIDAARRDGRVTERIAAPIADAPPMTPPIAGKWTIRIDGWH